MKLLNWFKKNTFYKVLVIAVVLALAGYAVWFFQPMPIIPEGAENFRLGLNSGDGYEADQYIIVDSFDVEWVWFKISAEGQEKLYDALKGRTVHSEFVMRSNYSYTRSEDKTLRFSIQYSYKGGEYSTYIYFFDVFRMHKSGVGETTVSPWDPAGRFETFFFNDTPTNEIYTQIMDIVKEYGTAVSAAK